MIIASIPLSKIGELMLEGPRQGEPELRIVCLSGAAEEGDLVDIIRSIAKKELEAAKISMLQKQTEETK